LGTTEGEVEHVAVPAPVRAKYQDDALVFLRGFGQRLFDLSMGIDIRQIDFFAGIGRLLQTGRIAALAGHQLPLATLLLPELSFGDVFRVRTSMPLGLKHNLLQPRLRRSRLHHLELDAVGLQPRPESNLGVRAALPGRRTDLRRWAAAVK